MVPLAVEAFTAFSRSEGGVLSESFRSIFVSQYPVEHVESHSSGLLATGNQRGIVE